MQRTFLVSGKRTPFGKFGGSLSHLTPVDLATCATRGLLNETKIHPETLDQVIFANVIPSTPDTLYAGRHLALRAGLRVSTPGLSVNRLCGSGIEAILSAMRSIRLRESEAVLVSGAENMSMAPHLTYGGRFGTKYGPLQVKDLLLDTLYDKEAQIPMGLTAENLAEGYSVTREESDQFAFESHRRAVSSRKHYALEISPLTECAQDEHVRDNVSLEDLRKLKPTFKREGTVTAGSASGIVDGACSVIVAGEAFVAKHSLKPLAELVDGHVVGVNPKEMGIGPVPAIQGLLAKSSLKLDSIDLFEINEAFAPQVLACQKAFNLSFDKLNIWGGAIAFGHPLGATGIKISLSLSHQLQALNKQYGIASACIGGGQGIALLMKNL